MIEEVGPGLADRPLVGRLFNGCEMDCDLSNVIERHIYFRGAYEPIEAYLFSKLLPPGGLVIDAGADIGQYTLIAASARLQVHAFEPVPANFEQLSDHVLRNRLADRVTTNRAALSDEAGTLTLNLYADRAGGNGTNYTVGRMKQVADSVTAPAVRLDDYAAEKGLTRLDLIKLDIEGSEVPAIRGGLETIGRHRPILLVEINRIDYEAVGYRPEELTELLAPLGYKVWQIGHSPGASGSLQTLEDLDRANVLFHVGDLPAGVIDGWSYRGIIRQFHLSADRRKG